MPQDYSEAVQNPHLTFSDGELKRGQIEVNNLGLPKPCAGAFAVVFKIKILPQSWAVKCFTSEILDQQRRYEAISMYLAKAKLTYTVPFTYMQNGIKVFGKDYPLVKMEWIQGESLSSFVERSLRYPETMRSLAKVWVRMMADLKAVNIAHGDLQHGNILVVGDQLRLIDYDGMFVPALSGQQSNELGHRNYQLPSRSRWDFGPYLDNFSAWLIYVSLIALAVHPELWNAHQGGDECLIFRKDDFVNPAGSALLRDLNSSPNNELRFLVETLSSFFSLSPQDIPFLDGNLPNIKVEPAEPWWKQTVSPEQRQPAEVSRTTAEEPVVPDPGWIIDSLATDKPIERIAFQSRPTELRIVAFGSLAWAFLSVSVFAIPASESYVIVSCVLGMNILLCFIHYRNDPCHAEFAKFKNEAKNLFLQVGEHRASLAAISAERSAIQERLSKTEAALAEQKGRLAVNLQGEVARLQSSLSSKLESLNQRRQATKVEETNKLNSLQSTLGNQITDLSRKIAVLDQEQADENLTALKALQDYFIQNYLRNHPVEDARIPGLSPTLKARVRAWGFQTAADVNSVKLRFSNIPGIGRQRKLALELWRDELENDARLSAPNLTDGQRTAIENKYRNRRKILEIAKQQLETDLRTQSLNARQYFADVRQTLNNDEKTVRSGNEYEKNRIAQEYSTHTSVLNTEVNNARNQVMPTINELSEKLRIAQKQTFALRWKSEKHKREGRRFESLRFRDYLYKIVSL